MFVAHGRRATTPRSPALVARTLDRFGRLDAAFNNAGHRGRVRADARVHAGELAPHAGRQPHRRLVVHAPRDPGDARAGRRVDRQLLVGRRARRASPASPAYAASKHGVVGLTKTAALDYADRRASGSTPCAPGSSTPRWSSASPADGRGRRPRSCASEPVGRLGRPEEIADAVAVAVLGPRPASSPARRSPSTAGSSPADPEQHRAAPDDAIHGGVGDPAATRAANDYLVAELRGRRNPVRGGRATGSPSEPGEHERLGRPLLQRSRTFIVVPAITGSRSDTSTSATLWSPPP